MTVAAIGAVLAASGVTKMSFWSNAPATQEVLALDWAGNWPVYHYLEDVADIAGRGA